MSTSPIPDPIAIGVARGWNVTDASTLAADRTLEADVVVVGSGAGGGVKQQSVFIVKNIDNAVHLHLVPT